MCREGKGEPTYYCIVSHDLDSVEGVNSVTHFYNSNISVCDGAFTTNRRFCDITSHASLPYFSDSRVSLHGPPRRSYDSCGGDFACSSSRQTNSKGRLSRPWTCDGSLLDNGEAKFSVNKSCEDVAATMLRFFSRRKAKGRAEQKVGNQAAARKPGSYKNSKDMLSCNIILLDGSDLGLEIGVS